MFWVLDAQVVFGNEIVADDDDVQARANSLNACLARGKNLLQPLHLQVVGQKKGLG